MKCRTAMVGWSPLALVAACTLTQIDAGGIAVEDNDLGVSHVEIDRNSQPDESTLEITGFDSDGAEIARLHLRVGWVEYAAEADEPPEPALGRELTITAGGRTFHNVIPDVQAITMPAGLASREVVSFARLSAVALELARDGLVVPYSPAQEDQLISYAQTITASSCDARPDLFTATASLSRCCVETIVDTTTGEALVHTYITATGSNQVLLRTSRNALVCRKSDGQKPCGPNHPNGPCNYGPCGFQSSVVLGTGNPHIFLQNGRCQWSTDDTATMAFVPTAHQDAPGVAGGSCNCSCSASGDGPNQPCAAPTLPAPILKSVTFSMPTSIRVGESVSYGVTTSPPGLDVKLFTKRNGVLECAACVHGVSPWSSGHTYTAADVATWQVMADIRTSQRVWIGDTGGWRTVTVSP